MKTIVAIAALAISATAASAGGIVPGSDTSEREADARAVVAVAAGTYGDQAVPAAGEAATGTDADGSVVPGIDFDR